MQDKNQINFYINERCKKEYFSILKQINITRDKVDTALFENKKILESIKDSEDKVNNNINYSEGLKSLIRSDAEYRNKKLTKEINEAIAIAFIDNKNIYYAYAAIGVLTILLIITFLNKF